MEWRVTFYIGEAGDKAVIEAEDPDVRDTLTSLIKDLGGDEVSFRRFMAEDPDIRERLRITQCGRRVVYEYK